MSNYQSVEAAVDVIFGTDEFGTHMHPFVGYLENNEVQKDDAIEVIQLKCFICQTEKHTHPNDENRQNLDEDEAKFLDDLLALEPP